MAALIWEPVTITASELTDDHLGWYIKVDEPDGSVLRHRSFELKAIRRWEYEGVENVGLLDPTDAYGRVLGTERRYPPGAAVVLLRPISRKAKARTRAQQQAGVTRGHAARSSDMIDT